MKKTLMALFVFAVAGALLFPTTAVAQDPVEDKIALSREGGTTRIAGNGNDRIMSMNTFSIQSVQATPEVEAFSSNDIVQITVQNYRGPAWVEIYGMEGAKHSSFEVYDMGFNVVNLSGLGDDQYKIRITLGSEVFSGTINKGRNGKRR